MIIPWKNVTKKDRFQFELFEQMIIQNDYVENRSEAEDALLYFVACHQYAFKLDVGRLRKMDKFTFWHDYNGLQRFLNKENGKIEGYFIPRCARGDFVDKIIERK